MLVVAVVAGAAAVGEVKEAEAFVALAPVAAAEDVVAVYLFEEDHIAAHIDSQVAEACGAALVRCHHPKEAAVAGVVVGSLEAVVSWLIGDETVGVGTVVA